MKTLILTQPQVRRLLPMLTCIELMGEALATLAHGDAQNPLRWVMRLADGKSLLGMMPGELQSPPALGLKLVAVFPGNEATKFDSHQGIVALFHPEHGVPLAIMDASEITAIRTAAVSGLATRLLAREDAGDLALLGSGVQARMHLEAMLLVRKIRRVRVYSPSRAHREAFAAVQSARRGIRVEAADSARAAVEGADLVCTVTSSREPVLAAEWIAPGTHINAAGASVKAVRELDTALVVRSRLYVDRRESTLNEAGDFLIPKSEGAIGDEHIQGEIGELLLGRIAGRGSRDEVTLFKSLGLAVEDLAAAHYLDRVAREQRIGTLIELGGLRHEAD